MAQRCPECDAPVEGAPWCGACGARLSVATGSSGVVDDGSRDHGDRRTWLRRLAVVAVLGVLGSVVVRGGPSDPSGPGPVPPETTPAALDDEVVPPVLLEGPSTGRQFAPRGSAVWARSDVPAPASAVAIAAAGTDHVLVGRHVLRTGGPATGDDAARTLPASAAPGVLDGAGRWAVAEFGRVVLGGTTSSVTGVVPDGWRPTGAAVAWHDGGPVLSDDVGHLGLLADDGTARWRTVAPVAATGAVSERWLAGVAVDGRHVVVDLEDGTTVGLAGPVLALTEDLAVTRPDEVVAVALPAGTEVWRRPADGSSWRTLDTGLAAVGATGAVLLDPTSGDELGRVDGAGAVATDDVVAVRRGDVLEATGWTGRTQWRLRLDPDATVLPVDGSRLAVRVAPPSGARVTIIQAATGLVVGDDILPTADDRSLTVQDDQLFVLDGREVVAAVDRTTGEDLDQSGPAPPRSDALTFGGSTTVTVLWGAATLRGTSDGETLWTMPFRSPLVDTPTRSGTSVVVLLADRTVVSVAPLTGETRWQQVLEDTPTAAASDGTMLLVGTAAGEVLRLDPSGVVVTRTVIGTGRVEALAAGRPAAALLTRRLVGIDVDG